MTAEMPAGVAGSASWVMMKRAALPSGDRKSFSPRWKSAILEGFRRQVEVVAALGGVEGLTHRARGVGHPRHLLDQTREAAVHREQGPLHGLCDGDHRRELRRASAACIASMLLMS